MCIYMIMALVLTIIIRILAFPTAGAGGQPHCFSATGVRPQRPTRSGRGPAGGSAAVLAVAAPMVAQNHPGRRGRTRGRSYHVGVEKRFSFEVQRSRGWQTFHRNRHLEIPIHVFHMIFDIT